MIERRLEKMSIEMINGARILLECFHRIGVTDIFGYPGGAVIPIYDEIYKYDGINHYFARHEQGAAHEADGYARVSGTIEQFTISKRRISGK